MPPLRAYAAGTRGEGHRGRRMPLRRRRVARRGGARAARRQLAGGALLHAENRPLGSGYPRQAPLMFTGIVECTGRIQRIAPRAGGVRMTILPRRPLGRLRTGESIAVSGACLTVTGRGARGFTVDVSPETLRRTTLGDFA